MADTKISALTELAETPAASDELAIVDKSDTTQAGTGTSKKVTKANLVADRQPLDDELTAIAGLTSAANKIPMFSGSGSATLIDFKDEDDMASDSNTAVPSQQSVKAYVTANGGGGDFLMMQVFS